MIISFAWTTPAVVVGEKTQTRRDWSRKTIVAATKVLQAGASVQAYDKSPRFGGKEFGTIRLTQIVAQEDSQTIPQEAWQAEGFHVLQTLGATIGKSTPIDVWNFWLYGEEENVQAVVHFELLELNDYGKELRAQTEKKLLELCSGNPL
jgi:hypothetical protein